MTSIFGRIAAFCLTILLLLRVADALPPQTPRLSLEKQGLDISLNWEKDSTATGYRLYYAPYPGMEVIGNLDLSQQHTFATALPNGAAFYVWVSAYNADGESRYSNIEHFVMDNKVVAFLPVNTNTGAQLQAGLQEAFAEIQNARLEVVWVDPNDNDQLTTLFFGTETLRGYAEDPDVVAVVTATTGQTLALTKYDMTNPLLVISATGTSTQLKDIDNVLTLAPDNLAQAELIFDSLNDYAIAQQKHVKYAVLLNRQPGSVAYSFDAYDYLLLHDIYNGIAIQRGGGITENDQPLLYPQLVGSFFYDGSTASIDSALATLDILQPDAVLHIGFGSQFQTLVEQRPGFLWLGSDSSYNYSTYQGKNVAVVGMSGQLKDYGYDAGGFLKTVMDALSSGMLDRQGILDATRQLGITYAGRTGEKGFDVEKPGSFELLMPGAEDWIKIK